MLGVEIIGLARVDMKLGKEGSWFAEQDRDQPNFSEARKSAGTSLILKLISGGFNGWKGLYKLFGHTKITKIYVKFQKRFHKEEYLCVYTFCDGAWCGGMCIKPESRRR